MHAFLDPEEIKCIIICHTSWLTESRGVLSRARLPVEVGPRSFGDLDWASWGRGEAGSCSIATSAIAVAAASSAVAGVGSGAVVEDSESIVA